MITSSGWRNSVQASQGGEGLLLGRKAKKALLKAKSISPRIILVEFDSNPKTTIISAYSPTNCSTVEEISDFYNKLSDSVRNIPAHNFVFILMDGNARLGSEDAPPSLFMRRQTEMAHTLQTSY